MQNLFRDQIFCPLNGGLPRIEVSQKGEVVKISGHHHRWPKLTCISGYNAMRFNLLQLIFSVARVNDATKRNDVRFILSETLHHFFAVGDLLCSFYR